MSKLHYLALSQIKGIGPVLARTLLEQFGSIESVFCARAAELSLVPRVSEQMAEDILGADLEMLERSLENIDSSEIDLLTWDDSDYPANLFEVRDAPYLLYVAGRVLPSDDRAVAVVGTREPSDSSREVATLLARHLAEAGVTVVSGLATGIDTAAHEGALAAEDGRTIAVLGSGLNRVHPAENRELAERITNRGALITEYGPNVPPNGPNLMARDRIVSGMSKAVLVVEAGVDSGSVDTAKRAKKQGRRVYAIPGSPGTNQLLGMGAEPLDPSDFEVEALLAEPTPEAPKPGDQMSLF